MFKENQTAHPPQQSLPACQARGRGTYGVQAEPQVLAARDKKWPHLWRLGGSQNTGEGRALVSWCVDGRAVSKGSRIHLTSWLTQQFSQEVWREHILQEMLIITLYCLNIVCVAG